MNKKMNIGRMAGVILIAMAVFVLVSNSVMALGISPGRTTLDFEPGREHTIDLRIINNEYKEVRVELAVSGELAGHVTLSQNVLEFREFEAEKSVRYTIKMPDADIKPGLHEAKIIAVEVPKQEESTKTGEVVPQIMSVVGVASQLHVRVPYPDSYIEPKLEISEAMSLDESTIFILHLDNLGKKDTTAKVTIDVLKNNKPVARLETEEKHIQAKQRADLTAEWKAKETGSYLARAIIYYSGNEVTVEKEFRVGELELALRRIYVQDYRLEQIAKVSIVTENTWNEQLRNVYGHLVITTPTGDVIADFKSAAVDIDPYVAETIYAYWDTKGIEKGSYEGKIIMYYNDKSFERQLRARVRDDDIEFEIIGITAGVVAARGEGMSVNTLLVIFITILVLANAAWFLYFKKRLGGRRKK